MKPQSQSSPEGKVQKLRKALVEIPGLFVGKKIQNKIVAAGARTFYGVIKMPHDRNGVEIKAGDRVIIECEVLEVTASEQYCNVKLQPIHPANPPEMSTTLYAINAAITEKGTVLEVVDLKLEQ